MTYNIILNYKISLNYELMMNQHKVVHSQRLHNRQTNSPHKACRNSACVYNDGVCIFTCSLPARFKTPNRVLHKIIKTKLCNDCLICLFLHACSVASAACGRRSKRHITSSSPPASPPACSRCDHKKYDVVM